MLQAVLEDLTPCTVEQYIQKQGDSVLRPHLLTTCSSSAVAEDLRRKDQHSRVHRNTAKDSDDSGSEDEDIDEDDDELTFSGYKPAAAEPPKLREQAQKVLPALYARRIKLQLDVKGENKEKFLHNRGRGLVHPDEVSITVVGLQGSLQPEFLFSAIYGIIPPAQAWRVPASQIQFFLDTATDDSKRIPKFYLRDQFIPYGPHLNLVCVNYHGKLEVTSDRVSYLRDSKVMAYKRELSNSADAAIRTMPDLALQLALDIVSDDHSEGLASLVRPTDQNGADAYREAFQAAMRQLHPDILPDALIHPTAGPVDDNLFAELGLTPIKVSSKAWEIMEASGAYKSLENYARDVLLDSPLVHNARGLDRLRLAMSVVAPDIPPAKMSIRNYAKSTPTVVWDKENDRLAFALPPVCEDHPTSRCLCWVGPFIHDAARAYDGPKLSTRKLFQAYLLCMRGDADMDDPEEATPEPEYDMDIGASLSLHDLPRS